MANRIATPEMQGVGTAFPVPAPFLGLNVREAYTSLRPDEARVLENWLPDGGSCKVRPGHAEHQEVSGATSVPTLMVYKGAASNVMVGAADGELYDVSGAPSALTAANYLIDRWSHDNFNGFLFGVNGTDNPWRFNGTVISDPAWTGSGLTDNNLETVKQVRNRLWFTEENSADVWYAGIASVTGSLTKFQLSQIAAGGKCIAINSWSRDGGDGADDFTVFVMSTGQVIVYQGDPATNFALVGKYNAPVLVERDATLKIGGELILITVSGPVPVSAAVAGSAFDTRAVGHWGKIASDWARDYRRYSANAGWTSHFFDGIAYFVVPTGLATTKQYVLNTKANNAWTTYTKLPVAQFADFTGQLYFGSASDGWVYRHGTGTDNGAQIVTLARQGASYPLGPNRAKQFTMFMPLIDANGGAQFSFALDVDFRDAALGGSVFDLTTLGAGAQWGDPWGSPWGAPSVSRRRWYSARGYGKAVGPVLRTLSTADSCAWFASNIVAVPGGIT